jgi:tetratricopeptide (TPR) repeat protein
MIGVTLFSKSFASRNTRPDHLAETLQTKGSAMKTAKLWLTLLAVVALLLPAGLAFSQGRMADIETAKHDLDANNSMNNRLRLATLQYLQGVDYLKAGDMTNSIDSLQASVWTLEDGKGQVPETHPVFEEARYGLGYALLQNNNPYEALLVLDQLVNSAPDFGKARYLLGVTLMHIPGDKSTMRGMDVLVKLAQDGRDPYKGWAGHAATRYAYDLSTLDHARGDSAAASKMLEAETSPLGGPQGADADENAKVAFAAGIYLRDSGDVMGALSRFEDLHKSNPGFRLSNGVALSGVLSNAYYAAGLQQLQAGGDSGNTLAGQMFEQALSSGDSTATDANHGKAVAYTRLGQNDKAVEALKAIVAKDPSYYDKIRKK